MILYSVILTHLVLIMNIVLNQVNIARDGDDVGEQAALCPNNR